jgi:hypothetical protein
MNSNTFIEKDGNILPIPSRLPFKSARFYTVPAPKLRTFSVTSDVSDNLYAYAIRNQQRNESIERLAFAALAGSGIAGILSVFL